MVQLLMGRNLGNSFDVDGVNKQINVKVDGSTIERKLNGALGLKVDSQAFIDAIRNTETKTSLTSRVDAETGARMIVFTGEDGTNQEINISSLIQDVHINGGVLDGQVLKLTDNTGEQVFIDLSVFMTLDEVQREINTAFNLTITDAFGDPIFLARSL